MFKLNMEHSKSQFFVELSFSGPDRSTMDVHFNSKLLSSDKHFWMNQSKSSSSPNHVLKVYFSNTIPYY